MKLAVQMTFLTLIFAVCNTVIPNSQYSLPIVNNESTYGVLFEEDVVYANGLSHESLNSANSTTTPLKLDVYTPNNELENRPAFMFIHGGSFTGGSKQQSQIINLANYYTSRGWVFISIDYRLKNDSGTVPQEWVDNLPTTKVQRFLAMYPAHRDAKAAMRWIVANANTYNINIDYITVGGASAGAVTAITLGISNQEDFRDEISVAQDPSLKTTNLEQTYQIKTIVDFWGSKKALDALDTIYNYQRFDNNDPPLFIAHGTEDSAVPFSNAADLKNIYESNGVPLAYYPLIGSGHSAWNAEIDNKRLEELAFDFIVEQQKLIVK